jgi:hypothetical protein
MSVLEVVGAGETPPQDSPEHIAAMVALAEGQTPIEPQTPATPPVVEEKTYAGKYRSVEDLEKGYQELVKKLGTKEEIAPEVKPEIKPNDGGITPPETPDIAKYSQEYAEKGELSEESYKELAEKFHLPKDFVDRYVEGIKAQQTQAAGEIYASVGGEAKWNAMCQWAAANADPKEVELVNEALSGSDLAKSKLMVQALFSQYEKAEGRTPGLVQGTGVSGSGEVFTSWAQVREVMGDKRYADDPAFRKTVTDKLGRSNL